MFLLVCHFPIVTVMFLLMFCVCVFVDAYLIHKYMSPTPLPAVMPPIHLDSFLFFVVVILVRWVQYPYVPLHYSCKNHRLTKEREYVRSFRWKVEKRGKAAGMGCAWAWACAWASAQCKKGMLVNKMSDWTCGHGLDGLFVYVSLSHCPRKKNRVRKKR